MNIFKIFIAWFRGDNLPKRKPIKDMTDDELKAEYILLYHKQRLPLDDARMKFLEAEFRERRIEVIYGVNLYFYKY